MEAIFNFTAILGKNKDNDVQLDEYCTGMTYGHQGSKVLVSVVNVFKRKDGKLRKTSSGFKQELKDLENSIYKTAELTFKDRSDKLKKDREEL